jgi:phage tail-like protein
MDVNGQNFWLMSAASHWNLLGEPSGLEYDDVRHSLRLAHQRREVSFSDNRSLAEERLLLTPQTLDSYGNRALFDEDSKSIVAISMLADVLPGITEIYKLEDSSSEISDIVMGYDGVLYIAINGRVLMHDRRDRWPEQNVVVPDVAGFKAWRMASDVQGGVWILDRENKKIARLSGMPLHRLAAGVNEHKAPRACQENTNPPHLTVLEQVNWPENEKPVAIACNENSDVVILSWKEGEDARVRLISGRSELSDGMTLSGSTHPYSLKWISNNRIAILLAGIDQEAPVYHLDLQKSANWPVGDLYPLKKDFNAGPFLHSLKQPPQYPTASASRALQPLSFPFFLREGEATNNTLFAPLDSGDANMVWHRLYLEAVIPEGCGIKVWLAATDKVPLQELTPAEQPEFFEHRFGNMFRQSTRSDIPVAVWEVFPSELPHQKGLLPCTAEQDKAGLFSVLIQRSTRQVRTLQGRYLHVQVKLTGQGRTTPEIFSLRAYGSRFSYIDEYLPQLYRETCFRPEADKTGNATAADFFARFVTNVEGVLSTIEDRIAQSYLLTDPVAVPNQSLPWLASWIGYDINQSLPESVQRKLLQSVTELYRWHGTLRGLKLALEIATEGGISGGEIVVLEDFRLRRTFASIIGADLDDGDDPLTAGASISGNSYVGDTLFIGDENNKEFLALFSANLTVDTSEQQAIEQLFDRLAYRVTILIHQEIEAQDLGLIRQIVQQEAPAHIACRVLPASDKFLVGMASLVGVDSYLANRKPPSDARVGQSYLGKNDFVKGPAALDSRLQGLGSGSPINEELKPMAFAPGVFTEFGRDIVLDGSDSRAFGGRSLTKYNWEYKGKGE